MQLSEAQKEILLKNNWRLVPYSPEWLEPYRQLVISEYGAEHDIARPEYIRWQYTDNPAGPAYLFLLLTRDDRAIGAYGVIPCRLSTAGVPRLAGISINTITHKDFRGRGIFAVLANILCQNAWSERGFSLIYGFPNPNSYPGFVRRFSFTDIGRLTLLLKPTSLGALLGTKAVLLDHPAVNFIGRSIFRKCPAPKTGGIEVVSLGAADERFTALWQRNQGRLANAVIRDAEYMQWRYFQNSVRNYTVLAALDAGRELRGYAVVRTLALDNIKCGLIGDLLIDQDREDVFRFLVSAAECHCQETNTALAGTLAPKSGRIYDLFKRAGFWPCPLFLEPQPFPMVVRCLHAENKDLLDLRKWYITMGDYDVF